MSLLIATDLDQTLIYSPGAASRGPQRDARVVELLDGKVISLLSSRTERDLRELQPRAVLVPATTRTRAQFERVDQPAGTRYAIVASGGGILVDGEPDLAWAASVLAELRSTASPLAEVHELLDGWRSREWLLRVRGADDMFLVAAVDPDLLGVEELADIAGQCARHGWRALHQGRKLYVVPNELGKTAAVAHVAERVAEQSGRAPTVLAAGDTLLDWSMMCAAERAWMPAGSELDRLGRSAPNLTRTAQGGLAAAEEIVAAWLEQAALLAHQR